MDLKPHGKTLFKKVGPLLNQIETLYTQFKISKNTEPRPLKIASNHTAMNYILPKMIKRFWKKHESCKIDITSVTQSEGLEKLENGTDAFIIPLNFDIPSDYSFIELDEFEIESIAHKDHPITQNQNITLKDISTYNLLSPPEDLMNNGLESIFTKSNTKITTNQPVSDWEISKKLVHSNLAITIGTSLLKSEEDQNLITFSLSKYFKPIKYGIIVSDNVHPLIHDFINSYKTQHKQLVRVKPQYKL